MTWNKQEACYKRGHGRSIGNNLHYHFMCLSASQAYSFLHPLCVVCSVPGLEEGIRSPGTRFMHVWWAVMQALGIKPRSSGRTSALTYWTISPAPQQEHFNMYNKSPDMWNSFFSSFLLLCAKVFCQPVCLYSTCFQFLRRRGLKWPVPGSCPCGLETDSWSSGRAASAPNCRQVLQP